MAVPKKKLSKTRQRQRHSAWRARFRLNQLVVCPNCGEMKLNHRVCQHCGQYKNKAILAPKTTVRKVKP